MLIPHKRAFLARRLADLGAIRLIERAARRPGLVVLAYHRIGDPDACPFYAPMISATPDGFRAQMAYLRDRFRVIGLDEAEALAGRGFGLDRPTALVTFDDGYRDGLTIAGPILSDLGLPAASFLTTDFLDGPALPWWDHVAFVLGRTGVPRLTLDRPEPMAVDLTDGHRASALRAVIAAYLRDDRPESPDLLAHLDDRAEVDPAPAPTRGLFLDWDDARRLADHGIAVGSHTLRHPRLARLPEAEQLDELAGSRDRLEAALGRPVTALAYPFGDPSAVGPATRRLAREAGYRLAFTLAPRHQANRPGSTDPLAVRRINIGSTDTLPLFRARLSLASSFGSSPL